MALVIGLLAPAAWAAKGLARFDIIDCTATRSHLASGNGSRTALTLQNVGTINVYLGFTGGPTTLTAANGFTLHAGSAISFGGGGRIGGGDPTVEVQCLTDGGSSRIQILEEF